VSPPEAEPPTSVRLSYLDSSAFVKLFWREPESEALRVALPGVTVSSDLLVIEALRVARRLDPEAPDRAELELRGVNLIPISQQVRDTAARIGPAGLRSLDAVHLATAHLLGDRIDAVLSYDERLGEAAAALGFTVLAPA